VKKVNWILKPGDASIARRTLVMRSTTIPRKTFNILRELRNIYARMLDTTLEYATENIITNFRKLKALKYRELRTAYSKVPSHYIHTACQDATTRIKSFKKNKTKHYAEEIHEELTEHLNPNDKVPKKLKKYLWQKAYEIAKFQVENEMKEKLTTPEVRNVSVWLDDHTWKIRDEVKVKAENRELTYFHKVEIATHRGWISIELEVTRQFYKLIARGFKPASMARMKLDERNRRVIIYVTFEKEVEIYKPEKKLVPVDVNEDTIALLFNTEPILLETNLSKLTLGYYYRRKRIQERNGLTGRRARRAMGKLGEGFRKKDYRYKIANLVVREALRVRGVVVIERLPNGVARFMVGRIDDKQLRHRVYQAALKGVLNTIVEKAGEYGVPVLEVDPKNTSKKCPIHDAVIEYGRDRFGVCSAGGERWHREVVALNNLFFRALKALDGGFARRGFGGVFLDGSPVPLGSTTTHEPTRISMSLWARWKTLMQRSNMNK